MRQMKRPWYQRLRLATQLLFFLGVVVLQIVFSFPIVFEPIFVWALLILAALTGPGYCGWLCPFGLVQELFGRVGSRVLKRRITIPRKINRFLIPIRFMLLGLSLAGVWALLFLSEPYMNFISLIGLQTQYIAAGAWVFLGLLLLVSFFVDRPFCRLLCTEGAQHGAAGLLRVVSIRRAVDHCTGCKRCDAACPTQVPVSEQAHVRHPQCINCFECITSCPTKGGLKLGLVRPRLPRIPRKSAP